MCHGIKATRHVITGSSALVKKRLKLPTLPSWETCLAGEGLAEFIKQLRQEVIATFGYELYLIADQVGWNSKYNSDSASSFDAVMPYALVDLAPDKNSDEASFFDSTRDQLQYWSNVCDDNNIHLIPSVFPGFNTAGAPWCYDKNNYH